jgi:hypothetical protein
LGIVRGEFIGAHTVFVLGPSERAHLFVLIYLQTDTRLAGNIGPEFVCYRPRLLILTI